MRTQESRNGIASLRARAAAAFAVAALGATVFLAGPQATAAEGDPVRGKAIYDRCIACHALERDRVGPRHCGLFGRRAGTVPKFRYSEAMRRSGIVWSDETLDRFLADPLKTVPGTTMGYAGIKNADERRDLIAWLRQADNLKALCPRSSSGLAEPARK
jgi:cytochrome c